MLFIVLIERNDFIYYFIIIDYKIHIFELYANIYAFPYFFI